MTGGEKRDERKRKEEGEDRRNKRQCVKVVESRREQERRMRERRLERKREESAVNRE